MPADPSRVVAATLVILLYLVFCAALYASRRRKGALLAREAASLTGSAPAWDAASENSFDIAPGDATPVVVAFASQTGTAQELAWQTARSLHAGGIRSRVMSLSTLTGEELRKARRVLFLVSTYGEGDPPDNAALFSRRLMNEALPLPDLRYGLLAMGDRSYVNFRGFGLALETWLARQGARALFGRVDADNADSEALRLWQQRVGGIAGTTDPVDWQAPSFVPWRFASRRLLNPGSAGAPVYRVTLAWPEGASPPEWEAGDLLQVQPAEDTDRPRDYSIASLPHDGGVELLVRREVHADGTSGLVSGRLTHGLASGDVVMARLRRHDNFRLGDNARRPLILVGNGTGFAGLAGLIRARELARNRVGPNRNWLIFGERNAAADAYCSEEVERWRASGMLERVDRVYSRDQPQRRYVQHLLAESPDAVRHWVQADAAIYVCGSLKGMAAGVDEALERILTRTTLDALTAQGRYRRDVY
jgi:sulfite reductase (NADPH) flavoprotein alpha-component